MSKGRSLVRIAAALVTLAILAAPAGAQAPLGSEFPVANPPGIQNEASVAVDPQGGFVVTWTDAATNNGTIAARRYDRLGVPAGSAITVNTTGGNRRSVVGANGAGEFVAAWEHYPDGSGRGVVARRLDANGAPIGSEFQVNTVTTADQNSASISVAPSGRFVVSWETFNPYPGPRTVHAQAFDAAGNRISGELQVSAGTTRQYQSAVSMDAAGAFIVAWADKERRGIYARRYDPAAQPVGGEFRVSTNSAASEIGHPSVAQAATGEFVVAWQRTLLAPPPPAPPDVDRAFVSLQRFDATGNKIRGEYQVPGNDQARYPMVAMHAGGRATLVWASNGSPSGVVKRAFDPAGRPVGPVELVAPLNAGPPSIGTEDASRVVIAWHSPAFGAETDIWARLYDAMAGAAMAVDAAATAGSDGNGVLEAGETVTVAPVWANLHGAGAIVPFAGTAANFTGPGSSVYSIPDASASYDAIPASTAGGCEDASPDCYRMSVSAPGVRPAVHWEATFDEQLLPVSEHGSRTWELHVGESFADVPRASPFYRFVETLLHEGVTGGCGGSSYCPAASTSREQMAVFALVGHEGTGYAPPPCFPPNTFDDVPESSPFCSWVEELARRGVVAGCGPSLYCPSASVSREQMAVFVLRTLEPSLVPPPCTPPNLFTDVPDTSPFCPWVEELAVRGIVTGCGPGLYCPVAPVTREQMAVFIAATFGLTLYGP